MRLPSLSVIFSVAIVLGLVSPGQAAAVWTSVQQDYIQFHRVCRDGIVLDYATFSGPGNVTFYLAEPTAERPREDWIYSWQRYAPAGSTGAIPEMAEPFPHVHSLGRRYTLAWSPSRAPGSQIKFGLPGHFLLLTIGNCSITTPLDPFTVGYVWADDPARASSTPSAFWSYNSKLLNNTVTRTGVGAYTVDFPGLAGLGGNAQVSAFGATPAICTIGNTRWYPYGSAMRLAVRCFSPNGTPADARFTASYTAGGGTGNTYAFAWADQPTVAGTYPGKAAYQYNNSGGPVTFTRDGVGAYRVTIPNLYGPRAAGTVKVTAVGDTPAGCKPAGWGPSGAAQVVSVRCFTHTGQPADQQFTITYADGMNHLGDNLMATAYVLADQPGSASYPPTPAYQRSTNINQSGTVTVNRVGVGRYDVVLPYQHLGSSSGGTAMDGGNAHVTAYGTDTARCQVGFWQRQADTTGRTARVNCFTAAGVPADARFTLQYTAQVQ